MGFSRQENWSGLPCPSPGDLPKPGIEPRSPALQPDSLPSGPPGKLDGNVGYFKFEFEISLIVIQYEISSIIGQILALPYCILICGFPASVLCNRDKIFKSPLPFNTLKTFCFMNPWNKERELSTIQSGWNTLIQQAIRLIGLWKVLLDLNFYVFLDHHSSKWGH